VTTSAFIYREYARAWRKPDGYDDLPRLLASTREAIQSGDSDDALIISYAAILLDLGRNEEALDWLLAHPLGYREYYENLGTAYAKNDPGDLKRVRRSNTEARNHPACPNAIVAYIDYQGM